MSATRDLDCARILGRCHIGDCWEWTLYLDEDGYGRSFIGSVKHGDLRGILVHRFVYETLCRVDLSDLVIDHLCKNRKCCNPDHLEPVTQAENVRRSAAGNHNKRKTHCPKGHDYAEHGRINMRAGKAQRNCRRCNAMHQARRQQQRKETAQ